MTELDFATLAGTLGGFLSVGAFLPQAYRIVQRRSATDVSLAMYVTIIIGSLFWMYYAYVRDSTSLLVTNVLICLIAVVIGGLRLRYGKG
jgi:MtN3 and saliva related transmembrane protein